MNSVRQGETRRDQGNGGRGPGEHRPGRPRHVCGEHTGPGPGNEDDEQRVEG